MAKVQTNCSIDDFLKEQAKAKGLNLSFELEKVIKEKICSKISNVPEEQLRIKCCNCGGIVEFGFLCTKTNKVFCEQCHIEHFRLMNGDKGERFACHISKPHEHIRIPGLNGQNVELLEKIAQEASNE
ncbi:MAG: hypothetical protein WC346_12470 [Methanogenium sp.]|jgi:Zn finger protein HypA/HybF involved in hydrogenase expression